MMLGLDIGTKRVGTALSNSGSNLATPYRTYSRESGQAEREILALIGEKKVKILVVGLPLGATGERTYQCRDIASFTRRLARRSTVEVAFVDEYLSSQEASERLSLRRRKVDDKDCLDSASAAIILQLYLDQDRKV